MTHRLLIVEDDQFVGDLLGTLLINIGYEVLRADSGKAMHEVLAKAHVDLILLDLTLPDEDGLVLARQLRAKSSIPIIVLTSREEREDRLAALEIGTDHFLTKPCDIQELSLIVRNILGRSSGPLTNDEIVNINGWLLDISNGTLTSPGGEDVILPRAEFDLLSALVKASNRVLSRGYLLDAVSQGEDSASERMIDVLISRLRKKFEINPKNPEIILTVPGRGYRYRPSTTRRTD